MSRQVLKRLGNVSHSNKHNSLLASSATWAFFSVDRLALQIYHTGLHCLAENIFLVMKDHLNSVQASPTHFLLHILFWIQRTWASLQLSTCKQTSSHLKAHWNVLLDSITGRMHTKNLQSSELLHRKPLVQLKYLQLKVIDAEWGLKWLYD